MQRLPGQSLALSRLTLRKLNATKTSSSARAKRHHLIHDSRIVANSVGIDNGRYEHAPERLFDTLSAVTNGSLRVGLGQPPALR